MKIPQVKGSRISQADLEKIKEVNIRKAKAFYALFPHSTKTYMALKTGLSYKFIETNWMIITGMLFPQNRNPL